MAKQSFRDDEVVLAGLIEAMNTKKENGAYHLRFAVPFTQFNAFLRNIFIRKHNAKIDLLFPSLEAHGYSDADTWPKNLFPDLFRMAGIETVLRMR